MSMSCVKYPCSNSAYQYFDPYAWLYNDPEMTDEYLVVCGFPTRATVGYTFPPKPAHMESLRGVAIVGYSAFVVFSV